MKLFRLRDPKLLKSNCSKKQIVFGLFNLILVFVLTGCIRSENNSSRPQLQTEENDTDPRIAWIDVYFSDPLSPNRQTKRGGPDQHLADAIDQARLSVDVAVYDFDLWSIRDALIDALRRGVVVRMVTDSDNLDEPEIQDLIKAGIPVIGDRHESLMHNKFIIIDRRDVWTGSMNMTINSAYKNNDNLVHLRSTDLAENYTTEFNEMFVQDQFGSSSPANTPKPMVVNNGIQLEVYFSPDDGAAEHIVRIIQSAHQRIDFMAYSLTSDEIAEAIVMQAQAGVQVSGVMEEEQVRSNQGGEYSRFLREGLDIRLDGNPANMHHKVIVIDGKIVITGSYNFSINAETKNDENVLVIFNQEIANKYLEEFNRVYTQAGQ